MSDDGPAYHPIGTAHIACPECQEVIPVDVRGRLVYRDDDDRGRIECDPDLTDLWAHAWTHTDGDDE